MSIFDGNIFDGNIFNDDDGVDGMEDSGPSDDAQAILEAAPRMRTALRGSILAVPDERKSLNDKLNDKTSWLNWPQEAMASAATLVELMDEAAALEAGTFSGRSIEDLMQMRGQALALASYLSRRSNEMKSLAEKLDTAAAAAATQSKGATP